MLGLIRKITNNFFCIFFTICWYAPAKQPPPKLAEANKVLANDQSVQCSSKPTGPIKQRLKKKFHFFSKPLLLLRFWYVRQGCQWLHSEHPGWRFKFIMARWAWSLLLTYEFTPNTTLGLPIPVKHAGRLFCIIFRRNRRCPQDILMPASLDTFQHFILISCA